MAGTTMNMPSMPAMAAPAGIATRTTAGWRWTIRPYTSGVTMLPVTMLNTSVQTIITAMSTGEPTAIVISSAIPVETNPPM